jgi:hypothetical protein
VRIVLQELTETILRSLDSDFYQSQRICSGTLVGFKRAIKELERKDAGEGSDP